MDIKISFRHWMSYVYLSTVYLLKNSKSVLSSVLAVTSPSYIIGLAYYELGSRTVNVVMPATVPNNAALVITLYTAYNPSFSRQYDAAINIVGSGRKNIKTIIWATFEKTLHFSSDLVNKQVSYSGYNKNAVDKVAQNEFGKDADVIYSSYRSPVNISVFDGGKY